MPTFQQKLESSGQVVPSVASLVALRRMRRWPVVRTMQAQDHVPAQSRRVIARSDTNGTDRNILVRVELTPGCFPMISVVAKASSAQGDAVSGTVTFYARTGLDDEQSVSIPTPIGLESNDAGSSWLAMRPPVKRLVTPAGIADASELVRWSEHVMCEIILTVASSVVDLVICEQPYDVAMIDTTATNRRTSHIISSGDLSAPPAPITHPVEQVHAIDDPRGGTLALGDVAAAQALRMGPTLFAWKGAASATTAFQSITNSSMTTYSDQWEGYSVASGGHGRRHEDNSAEVLHGLGSVIPVRIHVHCSLGLTDGVIRVQSSPDSWVDVTITASGWTSQIGYLEVGANADDFRVLQVFALKDEGGGSMVVNAVCAEYAQHDEAPSQA